MKSLNLDVVVSPQVGFVILILGFSLIIYGVKQSKKDFDIDNFPLIKPVFKEILGAFLMLFGFIQTLPILGNVM